MSQHGDRYRFIDRPPEEYRRPDVNPYIRLHREFGPPVVIGEHAPGHRGRWAEVFGTPSPLHVEIGPGNGFFLSGMAARHPDQSWLGVEIRFKRVVLCAKKIRAAGIENARITRYDAWCLKDIFAEGEIAGLHTNHPDPWPKEKQISKRLMSRPFAEWAAGALKPGARWRLKTDFVSHIERLSGCIEGLPFRILGRSDDVLSQGTPWPDEDDIVTNYQQKFYKKNLPIYALWLERI
jgi:tRNA (guanine-N7-)-methyltransferase